jgi:hypothetical protein
MSDEPHAKEILDRNDGNAVVCVRICNFSMWHSKNIMYHDTIK